MYFDGHQWDQRPVAPPALGQFLSCWCKPDPFDLFHNAWVKFVLLFLGSSQNGRRRPQKGKSAGFGLHLGHFHPCWRGAIGGNPLKVNISWLLMIFSELCWSLLMAMGRRPPSTPSGPSCLSLACWLRSWLIYHICWFMTILWIQNVAWVAKTVMNTKYNTLYTICND